MRDESGFTLIELLVAVAVTAILLLSVTGILHSLSATDRRLQADSDIYHQARIYVDRMSRELRGAYLIPKHPLTRFEGGFAGGGDRFLFSTTVSSPGVASVGNGMALVEYRMSQLEGGRYELLRREVPLVGGDVTAATGYRLLSGLKEVALRFYENGAWLESWSGDRLPSMVELHLVFLDENNLEREFLTAIELPMARGNL